MKNLFFILLVFLASQYTASQEKEDIMLQIEVNVTKYDKGKIYLALYDDEEHYMKKTYMSSSEEVEDHKVTIIFKGLKKGEYAFSLFHDVNSNGKLDNNFFGIPKEPYGFSNHQKGRFGPPKFDKVKFTVKENTHQKVTIK
ncbi:DUF2141 domain-containing protein [Flavobacteriaceae bacterium S356]|uniref:DUF2141 domain-containing protein n=1 Tax=Asprobacillus argus TaxID=3076534 RepID=A0ABU3LGF9_9FLAO|nr:DUF2141 domain-containing protein [Flavobacteriaceae bacterium S356]